MLWISAQAYLIILLRQIGSEKRNKFDDISKQQRPLLCRHLLMIRTRGKGIRDYSFFLDHVRPRGPRGYTVAYTRGKYIHALCLFANDFCVEDRRLEETRTLASLNLYCKHTFEISLPPLGKLPPLLSLIFLLLLFIIEESCDPLMNFPHGRWSCLQTNNIFSFLSYEISGK